MISTRTEALGLAAGTLIQAAFPPDRSSVDAAFEALHADAAKDLWRYAYRTSGDTTVAEDVVQESFLRLLARPQVLIVEAKARPYLFRVASNLLRDRWRRFQKHQKHAPSLSRPESVDPHDTALASDVQAVLGELLPRQRALLWLAYVEGCTHAEIAAILDVRALSVRVLLFRAKTKVAALLGERGYQDRIGAPV